MPDTMMAAAAAVTLGHAAAQPLPSVAATTTYHRAMVGGVGIFYREAGARDAPTILLLHGYPSSSRQWDPLLPLLADRYHVVAPDYPGFGQSDAPLPAQYSYTFDNLAATMEGLVAHLGIGRYTLFMQDYGGPVGFRMAQAHPEKSHGADHPECQRLRGRLGGQVAGHRQILGRPCGPPRTARCLHVV